MLKKTNFRINRPGVVKRLLYILPIVILVSCSKQEEALDRSPGSSLYNDQKRILMAYIDTLENSTDSMAIARALVNIENDLAKSSDRHSPNADYLMTHGQQDTLVDLTNRYLALRQEKSPKPVSVPDSIPTDTVR